MLSAMCYLAAEVGGEGDCPFWQSIHQSSHTTNVLVMRLAIIALNYYYVWIAVLIVNHGNHADMILPPPPPLLTNTPAAVSSFDPLPHFIPLLEFRDRIDHWKWIGQCLATHCGGLETQALCISVMAAVLNISGLVIYIPSAGHGRDSDVELLVLCNQWLDNLHRELVGTLAHPF